NVAPRLHRNQRRTSIIRQTNDNVPAAIHQRLKMQQTRLDLKIVLRPPIPPAGVQVLRSAPTEPLDDLPLRHSVRRQTGPVNRSPQAIHRRGKVNTQHADDLIAVIVGIQFIKLGSLRRTSIRSLTNEGIVVSYQTKTPPLFLFRSAHSGDCRTILRTIRAPTTHTAASIFNGESLVSLPIDTPCWFGFLRALPTCLVSTSEPSCVKPRYSSSASVSTRIRVKARLLLRISHARDCGSSP